jgi:hypothetical protein
MHKEKVTYDESITPVVPACTLAMNPSTRADVSFMVKIIVQEDCGSSERQIIETSSHSCRLLVADVFKRQLTTRTLCTVNT